VIFYSLAPNRKNFDTPVEKKGFSIYNLGMKKRKNIFRRQNFNDGIGIASWSPQIFHEQAAWWGGICIAKKICEEVVKSEKT
jgi:hypothetical protein